MRYDGGRCDGRYRLYLLNESDHIAKAIDLTAEGDERAMGEGRDLLRESRFGRAEVWQRARRLGVLSRPEGPGARG
jgi:hypothetical protein